MKQSKTASEQFREYTGLSKGDDGKPTVVRPQRIDEIEAEKAAAKAKTEEG